MQISKITYICSLASAALLMGFFETGLLQAGALAAGSATEYVLQIICVVSTLVALPLALKWRKIDLVDKVFAAYDAADPNCSNSRSDICRIAVLYAPLLLNVLCYYLFGCEATFGYMALMILVGFAFIWPQPLKFNDRP